MDAICAEGSDKGIEKALTRVPDNMDATYERILKTIDEKPRPQRELAVFPTGPAGRPRPWPGSVQAIWTMAQARRFKRAGQDKKAAACGPPAGHVSLGNKILTKLFTVFLHPRSCILV